MTDNQDSIQQKMLDTIAQLEKELQEEKRKNADLTQENVDFREKCRLQQAQLSLLRQADVAQFWSDQSRLSAYQNC